MKFNFQLKKICGSIYENGNLLFTPDGNSVISPIGNRLIIFDLVHQNCYALPFENRKNIKHISMSNNGIFLLSVDTEGHSLLINFKRQVVLSRFHFKEKVRDIKFSPNDKSFAVTFGNGCQIWKVPGISKEFSPLRLLRTLSGHNDSVISIDWSSDSNSLILGSKDLTARVYRNVNSKNMGLNVLVGHRDRIVGAFFSKDNQKVYSIARDGAVFVWEKEIVELPEKMPNKDIMQAQEDIDEYDSEDSAHSNESDDKIHMRKKVVWKLKEREFLWDSNNKISSVSFNKDNELLLIGFDSGVFGLYEMPGCVNIHKLSVSNHKINSVSINSNGEWLAIGSSKLGQLLVWEWQSESYVIRQQGHLYGLNSLDFSSDSQLVATAGEDSKVKLWNANSGFCIITFSEHIAPVTQVKFVGKGVGKALISSSLDGTVRAYDLIKYKNFRTMTSPEPVQFTTLAVDPSGEIVCAGSLDPFNIFVWSLQTGKLLDILSGHEGPIACLDFSSKSVLASGSWDGTLKLWDVYKNNNYETLEHGCDVLSVSFRPDGKEVCCSATNGNIYIWDVEEGTQIRVIEGRRDISGGRLTTDIVTSKTSAKSKYFNSVAYSSDGTCILAGGRSKYCCIYAAQTGVLIKKFQLSHNRSLEGILDELRSDRLVDNVVLDNINYQDSDDEIGGKNYLPGANGGRFDDGSRNTRPEVLTASLKFSPSGREWAVACSQGLMIFGLDDSIIFSPFDIDINITPQAILQAISREDYTLAINMALHLSEYEYIKKSFDACPISSLDLVVKSLDVQMLKEIFKFLAKELSTSRHIEFYLKWSWEILKEHGQKIDHLANSLSVIESIKSIIRVMANYEKDILKLTDENRFSLNFILSQAENNSSRKHLLLDNLEIPNHSKKTKNP